MMCNLLLLHASDTERITTSFLRELKGISYETICVDHPKFQIHPALQNPSNSRLCVVLFSPGFLRFLECKPEDAYSAFRHLNPSTTAAVFCCGLRESEIMCYHMAPLRSFNSWPKFEVIDKEESGYHFPTELIQGIREIFPSISIRECALIVPHFVSKDYKTVYVILTNYSEEISSIHAYIESGIKIYILLQRINPFVFTFEVPENFLEHNVPFRVTVHHSNEIIAEAELQTIHEFSDEIVSKNEAATEEKVLKESIMLDEQLQFLSNFARTSCAENEYVQEEDHQSINTLQGNDYVNQSLTALCEKYGLSELSFFINDQEQLNEAGISHDFEKLGYEAEDAYIPMAPIFKGDDEDLPLHRSLSLPSVIPPPSEFSNEYEEYIYMASLKKNIHKSTELSMSEMNSLNSLNSGGYVYMKWNRNSCDSSNFLKRDLSESQQELLELMHDFKHGNRTISEVEEQFRQWQQKHGTSDKQFYSPQNQGQKSAAFDDWKSLIQRKPKQKESKFSQSSDFEKRCSLTGSENSWPRDLRKESSASASSVSSKVSETSTSSTLSKGTGAQHKEPQVSTGWIPYTSSRTCPLFPENNPPPLPPRPSLKTIKEISKDEVKTTALPRRRARDSLPPIPQDSNESSSSDNGCKHCEGAANNVQKQKLDTLMNFCTQYGLEDLGNYFLSELYFSENQVSDEPLKLTEDGAVEADKHKYSNYVSHLEVSSVDEWDKEHNVGILPRSLSLPSTLCSVDAMDDTIEVDDSSNDVSYLKPCDRSITCQCESCILNSFNSIASNPYISLNTPSESNPSLKSLKNTLSESQQELLELIQAFKRGEMTMSQVEQQFQEWHRKHMATSEHQRERQLMQMQSQYEKARKVNMFGLPDIKSFIFGKNKRSNAKGQNTISEGTKENGKQRSKPDDNECKDKRKISFSNALYGVPDSGDLFRSIFQEAAKSPQVKQCQCSNSSKLPSALDDTAPELPPRPPSLSPASQKLEPKSPKERSKRENKIKTTTNFSPTKYHPQYQNYPESYQKTELKTSKEKGKKENESQTGDTSTRHNKYRSLPKIPTEKDKHIYENEGTNSSSTPTCHKRNLPPSLTCLEIKIPKENGEKERDSSVSNGHVPKSPVKRPMPPPKPQNISEKIMSQDDSASYESQRKKDSAVKEDDLEARPASPDYIAPNKARNKLAKSGNRKESLAGSTKSVSSTCACFKLNETPANSQKGKALSASKDFSEQSKAATQKRLLFKITNQWMKARKKEESMFYVGTRRWSSFPNLRMSEIQKAQPIYLELLP